MVLVEDEEWNLSVMLDAMLDEVVAGTVRAGEAKAYLVNFIRLVDQQDPEASEFLNATSPSFLEQAIERSKDRPH